jgi:ABC-type antimicrobial peptide transport system permease subunit
MLAGLGYFTGQRTREIGVRLALGAQRKDIIQLILSQGLGIVAIGIVLGILTALAATRSLTSFLFGVSPMDVLTMAGVASSACDCRAAGLLDSGPPGDASRSNGGGAL